MINDKKIDELIGLIYEAALDPGKWSAFLACAALALGSDVAHFLLLSPEQGVAFSTHNDFPEWVMRAYAEHFWRIDPRNALSLTLQDGQWLQCHEHFDNQYATRSEFYQDFLKDARLRYLMGSKLTQYEGNIAQMAWSRSQEGGAYTAEEKMLAERLTSHLQRAAKLNIKLLGTLSENMALTQTFERMHDACLVLNEHCRILQANAAAECLLRDDASPLLVQDSCFKVKAPSEQYLFQQAISACSRNSRQKSTSELDAGSTILLKRNPPQPALILQILPIPPAMMPGIGLMMPAALVWIVDPLTSGKTGRDFLRGLFGLTEAEARVAEALGLGKSLQEIADAHGVSRETVKSQASAIYGKTATRGQAGLIRLVARIQGMPGGFNPES